MKNLAFAILPSLFFSSISLAAPAPKVALCHFDEEEAAWVLISISGNAVNAHLRNHDDALPAGVTAVTGTQLDANCQVAAAPANADAEPNF